MPGFPADTAPENLRYVSDTVPLSQRAALLLMLSARSIVLLFAFYASPSPFSPSNLILFSEVIMMLT
jgi:hypothetical protein